MRHLFRPFSGGRLRSYSTAFIALLIAFCVCARPASALRRDAGMAIDANTGEVLYAQAADEPRYPASLTKMMTLYIAFSEIEAGRLSYESRLTISEAAASVAPSKLDLDPGSELSLIDGIKALVTKSANDVAVAIAERISGSESAFAALMTQRARELGMRSTHFRNASGLPDTNQVTTARDMLTLALRLHDDFPKHYRLFSLRYFTYKGDTHRNHNSLLFHYPGTEGLKTGYTRMSGFNLVTSVKRDGRHVVAAVFGGSTAGTRNAHMRSILNRAMARASKVKTRKAAPMLIAKPKVVPRPAAKIALKVQPKPAVRPVARPQPALAAANPPRQSEIAVESARPVQREAPPAQAQTEVLTQVSPQVPTQAPTEAPTQAMFAAAAAGDAYAPALQPRRNRGIERAPSAEEPAGASETVISKTSRSTETIARSPGTRSPGTLDAQLASIQTSSAPAVSPPSREPRPQQTAPQAGPVQDAYTGGARIKGRPPASLAAQAAKLAATSPEVTRPRPPERQPVRVPPAQHLGGPGALQATEIEIGAYGSPEEAEGYMAAAQAEVPSLAGRTTLALPIESNGTMRYQARFSGFDGASAEAACLELKQVAIPCRIAATP